MGIVFYISAIVMGWETIASFAHDWLSRVQQALVWIQDIIYTTIGGIGLVAGWTLLAWVILPVLGRLWDLCRGAGRLFQYLTGRITWQAARGRDAAPPARILVRAYGRACFLDSLCKRMAARQGGEPEAAQYAGHPSGNGRCGPAKARPFEKANDA